MTPPRFEHNGTIYEPHPACEVFPMLEDAELATLADDIRKNGLRVPVVLLKGKILDGRNRFAACVRAGVAPTFEAWTGKGDPLKWVVSINLHRRHLDESQRAMVGARTKAMFEEAAKARQEASLARSGEKVGAKASANLRSPSRKAADDAAALVNVSPRSVESASKVIEKGAPELIRAVEQGKVAVSTAAVIAEAPKEKQQEIVARGEDEILSEAKRLRQEKAAAKFEAKSKLAAALRAEPLPPPTGPYRVIVADPPWQYDARNEDATHLGPGEYPTMTIDEICAIDVPGLAHEDCILWLWTTNAFMGEAYRVLGAWGFTPKTILTWDKVRLGLGNWLRNITEHCIVAVRGKPIVQLTNQTTLLRESRREHSRKPEAFYALVDGLCPGSKVEMFARAPRPGWATWGAETEKFANAVL